MCSGIKVICEFCVCFFWICSDMWNWKLNLHNNGHNGCKNLFKNIHFKRTIISQTFYFVIFNWNHFILLSNYHYKNMHVSWMFNCENNMIVTFRWFFFSSREYLLQEKFFCWADDMNNEFHSILFIFLIPST